MTERLGARRVVPWGAIALASVLVGCGASDAHHSPTRSVPTTASAGAVRWWSNAAVAVGSQIDAAHPDAAAARLQPSQADYCGMLKQTVAAGKSILPDLTSTDPALLISARAFIAEIQKVAPAGITIQWHVVGPAVLSLVRSGGDTGKLPAVDLGALTKAATAISVDARARCGVDLSSVTGLLPKK